MKCFLAFVLMLGTILSDAFIGTRLIGYTRNSASLCAMNNNERALYKSYIIGLRKTRRYMNSTNIDTIRQVLDYTNDFTKNNSMLLKQKPESTGVKSIAIGNVVIDVSTIKHIHIYTKNDSITIELDHCREIQTGSISLFSQLNSIDNIATTISFISKMVS